MTTIRVLILGKMLWLKDVLEIPSLGEVLTIGDLDFVVSNINLRAEMIGSKPIPHLNLLPVKDVESEAA